MRGGESGGTTTRDVGNRSRDRPRALSGIREGVHRCCKAEVPPLPNGTLRVLGYRAPVQPALRHRSRRRAVAGGVLVAAAVAAAGVWLVQRHSTSRAHRDPAVDLRRTAHGRVSRGRSAATNLAATVIRRQARQRRDRSAKADGQDCKQAPYTESPRHPRGLRERDVLDAQRPQWDARVVVHARRLRPADPSGTASWELPHEPALDGVVHRRGKHVSRMGRLRGAGMQARPAPPNVRLLSRHARHRTAEPWL